MNRQYTILGVLNYIDRGIWYRGFQPFVAKRLPIAESTFEEERVFVQILDDFSFMNQNGEQQIATPFDYLDITDLDLISSISKEEFEQNFEIMQKDEEKWCQILVKLS